MNRFSKTAALVLLLVATPALQAGDDNIGKSLVAGHCTSCHGDAVYTRENRRVNSLEALQKQVRRCELSLGLKWFDDDINAVTGYLNKAYYHFK